MGSTGIEEGREGKKILLFLVDSKFTRRLKLIKKYSLNIL
jgi:hypothetical protein